MTEKITNLKYIIVINLTLVKDMKRGQRRIIFLHKVIISIYTQVNVINLMEKKINQF